MIRSYLGGSRPPARLCTLGAACGELPGRRFHAIMVPYDVMACGCSWAPIGGDKTMNRTKQIRTANGLGEIVIHAHIYTLLSMLLHCVRGQSYNRRPRYAFSGFHLTNSHHCFIAVHLGHLAIHEYNCIEQGLSIIAFGPLPLGCRFTELFHRLQAIDGGIHCIPALLKHNSSYLQVDSSVIDQEQLAAVMWSLHSPKRCTGRKRQDATQRIVVILALNSCMLVDLQGHLKTEA
mmetsp:Transcript_15192/g.25017  ORF Transcript_15192/g.25017 Transcript_15192/m.25017 type:complete len:234 (+) Transcript_15192:480-1181(+)